MGWVLNLLGLLLVLAWALGVFYFKAPAMIYLLLLLAVIVFLFALIRKR